MSLQGRNALVTGGSRGIGRAICLELARQGANVAVNYAGNAQAAEETAAACRELGVQAVTIRADVADAAACEAMVKEVISSFGSLHILVNNAGITRDNLALSISEADFDAVLDTNLKGAFCCCKAAYRPMMRQRYTVNAVAPGFIDTDMTAVLPEAAKEALLKTIPMARLGQPEDVARAVAFFAADETAYVTGQVLCVDGGMAV